MPLFHIHLQISQTKTEAIECESRDEAFAAAKDLHPGWRIDSIDEFATADADAPESAEPIDEREPDACHYLAGTCEGCSQPIWEGEPHSTDGEGISFCPDCIDPE